MSEQSAVSPKKDQNVSAEEIRLYRCRDCPKPVYQDAIDTGRACSCGSRYVKNAPASFRYVFGYLWHNHLFLRFIWENVLHA